MFERLRLKRHYNLNSPKNPSLFHRWHFRRLILLILFIAIIGIAIGVSLTFLLETTTQHTATLRIRMGEVRIQPASDKTWQPAEYLTQVKTGDWVWLDDGAVATIHYFDDSKTLIWGPAQVKLSKSEEVSKRIGNGRTVIELDIVSGKVLSEVARESESATFHVRTPYGAIQGQDNVFQSDTNDNIVTNWLAGDPDTKAVALVLNTGGEIVAALIPLGPGYSASIPHIPEELVQGDSVEIYNKLRSTASDLLKASIKAGSSDVSCEGTSLIAQNPDTGSAVYSLSAASELGGLTASQQVNPITSSTGTIVEDKLLADVGITVIKTPVIGVPSIPDLASFEANTKSLAPPKAPVYVTSIYGVTKPLGVAVHPDGEFIYVTESGGSRLVHIFDREGTPLGTLSPPDSEQVASRSPVYIAVDRTTANIYVSDRTRQCIDMYDYSGAYIGKFTPELEDGTDWVPHALTFDGLSSNWGDLYVTNFGRERHSVMVFDYDGSLKLDIGESGNSTNAIKFPNGVATDSLNYIYISDSNNFRLRVFSPEGTDLGSLNAGLPRGIAVNERDLLHLVDVFGHRVVVYQVGGTVETRFEFGDFGSGSGHFNYPNSIAIDYNGRVYVTDRENNRVQIWEY